MPSRKGFPHGVRSLQLPIKVKNGPQTMVLLRANVTTPEVELSHDELDFDDVLIGQGKTRYLQVKIWCRVCSKVRNSAWLGVLMSPRFW